MTLASDLRAQIEDDLAWRADEIRHLRNTLLGTAAEADWPSHALRAILVLQYAHLEGFARSVFESYVNAVNALELPAGDAHPHLVATALTPQFEAIRRGNSPDAESDDARLTRRAKVQVDFVEHVYQSMSDVLSIDIDAAVSMEMNFGSDVFRRTLYRLGIPETEVHRGFYKSLEFIRKTRNDIAHGLRRERISGREFAAHQRKSEEFMDELARLVTAAVRLEMFKR